MQKQNITDSKKCHYLTPKLIAIPFFLLKTIGWASQKVVQISGLRVLRRTFLGTNLYESQCEHSAREFALDHSGKLEKSRAIFEKRNLAVFEALTGSYLCSLRHIIQLWK